MQLRTEQKVLILASAASLVLWLVSALRLAVLPLVYLNTQVHELCHALVALSTGGQVSSIQVFADGSGVTNITGGNDLLVGSAGYLGSSVLGGIALFFSKTTRGARATLWTGAALLALALLGFVRGGAVGLLFGVAWCLALAAMAWRLDKAWLLFAAQFIGVQQCLTAAHSMLDLLKITAVSDQTNDALLLQQSTHVPAMAFAVMWFLFGMAVLAFSLRAAWRGKLK